MKLDREKETLYTSVGTLCTILVYIIVLLYTYLKFDVWIQKKDVDIMQTNMIGYLDADYTVDYDKVLNVAIAFTAYDNESEPILDKKFGELIFNAYEWGINEDGKFFVTQD